MTIEKRSLAIDEMKEVLKHRVVKKLYNGRIWVVCAENKEEEHDTKI